MMANREQTKYEMRTKEQKLEGRSRKKKRTFTIIGEDWGTGSKSPNLDKREEQLEPAAPRKQHE